MLYRNVLLSLVSVATAKVYLKEDFSGDWESRWVVSDWKKDTGEAGAWEVTAGKFFADAEASKGLRTTEDAKFYAISTKFPPFSNKDKTLIIQYVVKHEQNIDCGGGYMKLFPSTVDQQKLHGGADEDVYNMMFGPDICGSDKKTHVIFHYKGKNHLVNKRVKAESDTLSHLYKLSLTPDGKYTVAIDGTEVQSGELREDWDFLPPKMIKDPATSKPSDWVDEKMIDDPEDKKPEGWDEIPKEIPDPDATVPDDWDEADDGEWEPPNVPNPEYKGEWHVKRIDNPAYKGEWVHPDIDNPEYKDDATIAYAEETYTSLVEAEKKAKDAADEAKKAAEKEAEKEDTDDDEDNDDDDDDEEEKDEL